MAEQRAEYGAETRLPVAAFQRFIDAVEPGTGNKRGHCQIVGF